MRKFTCYFAVKASLGVLLGPITVAADTSLFTKDDVLAFSPRSRGDLVEALLENQDYLTSAGITTPHRLAHFFTQVATETAGLQRIDENLNYSHERLLDVFSRQTVSADKAREIAGKPRQIANWVYGDRLGNRGRHTNDGWDYRGSGYIQLTGRSNFKLRGEEVGLPLAADPEIARRAREGLLAAIAYWDSRDVNRASDDNDIHRVRILVNGAAAHGLGAAEGWFPKAWKVFGKGADIGITNEEIDGVILAEDISAEMNAAAKMLEKLGFMRRGIVESGGLKEDTFSDSLRAYQKSRGLEETGVLDEDTFYAITDPQEWRHREPADTTSGPVSDPESSVTYAFKPVTEGAAVVSLEPNPGTGVWENTQLSKKDLSVFSESEATYASYERSGGERGADNSFIPHSVFVPDDRKVIENTTEFPARAIVQINFALRGSGSRHFCSGAMISLNTVLTAGHCVHEGARSGDWYTDFKVYPGRNTGAKPFGSCGVTKLFALKGWVDAADESEARYYDLGAMKLDCDIGTRTGWFGIRTLDEAELDLPTTVQGYAADRTPAGRQWVSKDRIRALQSAKVFYQNDTFGGTSGAPVYSGDHYQIVGIHTNGMHNGEPWKSNNAFTRITSERLQRIADWIEE